MLQRLLQSEPQRDQSRTKKPGLATNNGTGLTEHASPSGTAEVLPQEGGVRKREEGAKGP